jgi:hypothetical protein
MGILEVLSTVYGASVCVYSVIVEDVVENVLNPVASDAFPPPLRRIWNVVAEFL